MEIRTKVKSHNRPMYLTISNVMIPFVCDMGGQQYTYSTHCHNP